MSSRKKKDFREEDMHKPVYDYLSSPGYTVRSEASHCDIAAVKEDGLLAVEMKKGGTKYWKIKRCMNII